jgi:hypothetical protein
MVQRLSELVDENGTWRRDCLLTYEEYLPLGDVVRHDKYLTSTAGRLIGSLVKYYTTTRNEQALELASRFRFQVLKECFDEEGRATDQAGWHVHSITSTMSSLAHLADVMDDTPLKSQVGLLYRGVFDGRIMTAPGWSKENLENDLDVGEINNTGDVIQTALRLADWESASFFEDAERMLRSHVIPSQLLETDWIEQVKDPTGDFESGIPSRVRGAFGFPAPYGQQAFGTDFLNFNFDITCGGVQALCEVATRAVDTGRGLRVNLLIDHTAPGIAVRSLFPGLGSVTVEVLSNQPCEVRIPEWIDRRSLKIRKRGTSIAARITNGYLDLGEGPGVFQIEFHAHDTRTEEWINGRLYCVNWKGNQIVAMDPSGEFLPFFESCSTREAVSQGKQR